MHPCDIVEGPDCTPHHGHAHEAGHHGGDAGMILAASTVVTMVVSMVVAGIIEPSCLRAPSVCLTHLE